MNSTYNNNKLKPKKLELIHKFLSKMKINEKSS